MKGKFIRLAAVLGILILATGCTHSLEVLNLDSYTNTQLVSLKQPTTVGIVTSAELPETQRLVKGIASGLGKYSANVILPYTAAGERKADVVAQYRNSARIQRIGMEFSDYFSGVPDILPGNTRLRL